MRFMVNFVSNPSSPLSFRGDNLRRPVSSSYAGALQERGHYFVFFCVLLAIVYVLSRTGTAANCDTPSALMDMGSFDIG